MLVVSWVCGFCVGFSRTVAGFSFESSIRCNKKERMIEYRGLSDRYRVWAMYHILAGRRCTCRGRDIILWPEGDVVANEPNQI